MFLQPKVPTDVRGHYDATDDVYDNIAALMLMVASSSAL